MLLFNAVFSDDDLTVLSAYLCAQEVAEASRKSEFPEEPALSLAGTRHDASDESVGDAGDDEDVAQGSRSPARRTGTWIPRLREVKGVAPDRMAPIHGRLIAHGLLQFQLQGRDEGVVYRVTSAGRQMLMTPDADAA